MYQVNNPVEPVRRQGIIRHKRPSTGRWEDARNMLFATKDASYLEGNAVGTVFAMGCIE